MVEGLDLIPLTNETIAEMAYESHDLWLIKIGSSTFGPYETQSLKHYVNDNEHLFEKAYSKRMDEENFRPFWSSGEFQRRKLQAIAANPQEGPFWILDYGLKQGPLNFLDVDKKIEMGLLVMTDHISIDDGKTWVKIFEIEGFDRRTHNPDLLPKAPKEASFQSARLALVEKMEKPHVHTTEELATMAYSGQQIAKVIQFKSDEVGLKKHREIEVSSSFRWAIPLALGVIVTFVTVTHKIISGEDTDLRATREEISEREHYSSQRMHPRPKGVIPSASRFPASTSYGRPSENFDRGLRHNTQIETHDQFYDEPQQDHELAPLDAINQVEGSENNLEQRPAEYSLVGNQQGDQDHSLDAAMNGIEKPADAPVIEEVSDF